MSHMPSVLRVKGGGADWIERREWMSSCVDSVPCLTLLTPPYQCEQLPTAVPKLLTEKPTPQQL